MEDLNINNGFPHKREVLQWIVHFERCFLKPSFIKKEVETTNEE